MAISPSAKDVGITDKRFQAAIRKRLQTAMTDFLETHEKMGNLSKETGLIKKKPMEITEVEIRITRLLEGLLCRGERTEDRRREQETSCLDFAGPKLGKPPEGPRRGPPSQGITDTGGCAALCFPSASFCVRLCPLLPEMSDSHEVFVGLFWLLCDT